MINTLLIAIVTSANEQKNRLNESIFKFKYEKTRKLNFPPSHYSVVNNTCACVELFIYFISLQSTKCSLRSFVVDWQYAWASLRSMPQARYSTCRKSLHDAGWHCMQSVVWSHHCTRYSLAKRHHNDTEEILEWKVDVQGAWVAPLAAVMGNVVMQERSRYLKLYST